MIISAVTLKGGSGKTTTLTCLAAHWASKGYKVGILDLDPQCASAKWCAQRTIKSPDSPAVDYERARPNDIEDALSRIDEMRKRFQILLLDVEGRDSKVGRMAMLRSDITISPIRSGGHDYNAAPGLVSLLEQVQTTHQDLWSLCFLSQTRERSRITRQVRSTLSDMMQDRIRMADTEFNYLDDFAMTSFDGLGATEVDAGGRAAVQVRALAKEIEDMYAQAQHDKRSA